jgi:MSHA pilin protein MshA
MEGATVTMVNGYPTADAAGIVIAANISANDYTLTGGTPYAIASDSGHVNCRVTYLAATTTAPPVVDKSAVNAANGPGNCG